MAPVAPALLANNRLGWNGLTGTNTPACYEHLLISALKTFIALCLQMLEMLDVRI